MSGHGAESSALPRRILCAAGAVGFAAVVTQLVMMRELLAAFSGNELVFGVSLGAWLLLTGAGALAAAVGKMPAAAGGASSERRACIVLGIALVAIALLPFGEVMVARGLRDAVFGRGTEVGAIEAALGCLAVLAPFCLVSGGVLAWASGALERTSAKASAGRVYLADAAGGVAGGLAFTFGLAPWCEHFVALEVTACVALLAAIGLAWAASSRRVTGAVVVGATTLLALARCDLDRVTTNWQHRGEIVWRGSSPYGRLVVTRTAGQLVFFENGAQIGYSDDVSTREETVHYAMAQRPAAPKVLLLSGAASGAANEVLRYGVDAVTCVELDPGIAAAARVLMPKNFSDERLHFIAGDGRRFVQRTRERFEVVMLVLPDPATLQLNRFFTEEFFAEVKRVLTPGGVLAFGLGHYENFVSDDLAEMLASARRTLAGVFRNVRLIPGGRVFFVASDGELTLDIAGRMAASGIEAQWVRRSYLDAMLTPDRLADLARAVDRPAVANRDFDPVIYFYELRHWLGQFERGRTKAVGVAVLVALGVYAAVLPAVPRVIFASGFTASALEVVLMLALQVCCGALYQQAGGLIAVFMAGFAAGAWWMDRRARSGEGGEVRLVALMGAATAGLGLASAWALPRLPALDAAIGAGAGQTLILALAAGLGASVGAQFPPAGAVLAGAARQVAGRLFGADLVGAAAGALLASAWLIPALGVAGVCAGCAGLNALAVGILWWRKGRHS